MMLSKIKTLLSRTTASTEAHDVASAITPAGYFLPQKAEQLAATPFRKNCLQKIWETCSLPADVYQQIYRIPVYNLIERVQNVPAATNGRWAHTGGFTDLTLQFTSCVTRISRSYMFPPGAASEEQAEQSVMWHAVIFLLALFHHLPLLASLEGEIINGLSWQPGISVPQSSYRFRFRRVSPNDEESSALAALAASQLIPTTAIDWFSGNYQALCNLAGVLWNRNNQSETELPLIRSILKQASEIVESPLLAGSVPAAGAGDCVISTPDPQLTIQPTDPANNEKILPEGHNEEENNIQENLVNGALTLESALSDETKVITNGSTEQERLNADTDVLLYLFRDTEPELTPDSVEKIDAPVNAHVQQEQCMVRDDKSESEGTKFLNWLRSSTATGTININGVNDKLHMVSGCVFLPVPEIFFDYLKSTGLDVSREALQLSFEDLNVHKRRENKRFYFGRLYENSDRTGKHRRVKGYLIEGRTIFANTTGDSQYFSM